MHQRVTLRDQRQSTSSDKRCALKLHCFQTASRVFHLDSRVFLFSFFFLLPLVKLIATRFVRIFPIAKGRHRSWKDEIFLFVCEFRLKVSFGRVDYHINSRCRIIYSLSTLELVNSLDSRVATRAKHLEISKRHWTMRMKTLINEKWIINWWAVKFINRV